MLYKWRKNLTLKEKFKTKDYRAYSCVHSDSPSEYPCEHPSHYEAISVILTRKELMELSFPYNGYSEGLKRKLSEALRLTEYPYKEGY